MKKAQDILKLFQFTKNNQMLYHTDIIEEHPGVLNITNCNTWFSIVPEVNVRGRIKLKLDFNKKEASYTIIPYFSTANGIGTNTAATTTVPLEWGHFINSNYAKVLDSFKRNLRYSAQLNLEKRYEKLLNCQAQRQLNNIIGTE
jgi:hypothetical protein